MTIEEYQLALCLAGTTIRSSDGEERFVPLLEGVREKCPECDGGKLAIDGCGCQGRSWVPRPLLTDPWPWFKAIKAIWPVTGRPPGWDISDGPLTLAQALAEALGVKDV